MAGRPRKATVQKELDQAAEKFEKFDAEVKSMTMDAMNKAPIKEEEPQTKLSQKEKENSDVIYLKPKTTFPPGVDPKTGKREVFNENFRKEYNYQTERVNFIAENKEVIGETIEKWTKPFPGMNCEMWQVPTNRIVNGPRHLAESIKRCTYTRIIMKEHSVRDSDTLGTWTGVLTAESKVQRLDAHPADTKKSIFMGASGF